MRALALFGAYQLAGRLSDEEIRHHFDIAPSTLRGLYADLAHLGLPALGASSTDAHEHLVSFLDALDPIYPNIPVLLPTLPEDAGDDLVTTAPWLEDLPDFGEAVDETQPIAVECFDHFLTGPEAA